MTNNKKGPGQLIQKISAAILAIVAFITAIIQFSKLWHEEREVATVVLSFTGLGILLILVLYYSYRFVRFMEKRIWDDLVFPQKIIILVADFDGPEYEKYRVTDTILSQIRQLVQAYNDIVVQSLNECITEKQGRKIARLKGRDHKASIVIWGWYSATNPAQITAYFEIIRDLGDLTKEIKEAENYPPILKMGQIESLELQTELARDMNYLVLFVAGLARFMAGDWDRAISRFTEMLNEKGDSKSLPDRSGIYAFCGQAYSEKNDHKNAIICYNQALEIHPDFVDIYFQLGNEYAESGDLNLAIESISKFIEFRQNDAPAYYNRGNFLRGLEKYSEAIEDYNKAIDLEKQSELKATYLTARGTIHWLTGKTDHAVKDYDQAISLSPDHILAYLNRGGIYLSQEDYDKAINDYNRCIKLQPNNAQAFLNRGRAYANHGFVIIDQHAIKDEDGVILRDERGRPIGYLKNPGDKYSWHDELRDFSKALKDFARAIELRPDWEDVYWFRSQIQMELGKFNDALKDTNQILQLSPENTNAYCQRARIHSRLKNYKRAIADYSRAIQIQPNLDDVYFNRGSLYMKIGEYEKATNDLHKFIELTDDPNWKRRAQNILSRPTGLE